MGSGEGKWIVRLERFSARRRGVKGSNLRRGESVYGCRGNAISRLESSGQCERR